MHPEVVIPLLGPKGRTIANLRVVSTSRSVSDQSISILNETEAKLWGEEPIQLLEGRSYDYEIEFPSEGMSLAGGVFQPGRLSSGLVERGRLETGEFTGCLPIVLYDAHGQLSGKNAIEVRSIKLDYRSHYRTMLEDIANHTIDLLLDVRTPSFTRLNSGQSRDPSTQIQKFFLIKNSIESQTFMNAMLRIIHRPHEKTVRTELETPVSRGIRPRSSSIRELSYRQPRERTPSDHPLSNKLGSLPRSVRQHHAAPTRDTAENRFVKFMLRYLDQFLADAYKSISDSDALRYKSILLGIASTRSTLAPLLSNDLFKEVSNHFNGVPFSSPVLLRKPGYRELFQIWLSLQVAVQILWEGANDVFLGGKKDVATLYEYWVFFELWGIVKEIFQMSDSSLGTLIDVGYNGLFMKLKSGKRLDFLGQCNSSSTKLSVRFSYNRTFSRKSKPKGDPAKSHPNPGTWTKTMRPDYTVSLWPAEMSEEQAEFSEAIKHIHFDAKYRVNIISEVFGDEKEDERETRSEKSTAKRSDLLKMHAYRDAIRRSVSAFVLYPGDEDCCWRQFEEIIPGLGAIAIRPGDPTSRDALKSYLLEVSNYVASPHKVT